MAYFSVLFNFKILKSMKNKFIALVLGLALLMPSLLWAEEVEIQLMEVIGLQPLPGDEPLDGPSQDPTIFPCSTCFRATINGHSLSVTKLETNIPSAQATVVNAQTGSIVVNRQFTNSLSEQITNSGVYVLHINTEGGALVGQFIVQ